MDVSAHDMGLSDEELNALISWRHFIHQHPELSGEEKNTAAAVVEMLKPTAPSEIVTGIGGHGVAAIFDSGIPGPRVLLRCELDGIPIQDLAEVPHRSVVPGKGHQCGHDGHMAIMLATARLLSKKRPERGAVILLFQPAEEDGSGARRVVADPAYLRLSPDYCFAIHNMPGRPFGIVDIVDGPAACASRGMILKLMGRTAHASQPETGLSPMLALSELMPSLTGLGSKFGTALSDPDFGLVTITHVKMGAEAFGVAPAEAVIFATIRTLTDGKMKALVERAENLVFEVADREGLKAEISYSDIFDTCCNSPIAVEFVRMSLDEIGISYSEGILPMRASEDFGCFGQLVPSALLLLGSGNNLPALHNPDFDFPDQLIPIGAKIFRSIIDRFVYVS